MKETEILAQLERLGPTADLVAQSLRERGIQGRRKQSSCCPLARFVRSIAADNGVSVGSGMVRVWGLGYFAMPRGCVEFEEIFDGGGYPDLVEGYMA